MKTQSSQVPPLEPGKKGVKQWGISTEGPLRKRLYHFCNETTLHGWRYVVQGSFYDWHSLLWLTVLCSLIGTAIWFIVLNTTAYVAATTQTSFETTTASMKEVFFPAVTVCNINQIEASFMEHLEVYDSAMHLRAIYNRYITGNDPFENQDKFLESVAWFRDKDLLYNASFGSFAHQKCSELVVGLRFGAEEVFWDTMATVTGPLTVGTDYGFCCLILPQVSVKKVDTEAKGVFADSLVQLHDLRDAVQAGSKNGENHGLALLLDIQNFNFGYTRVASQGVRLAVHHHRNNPIMEHDGLLISAGKETRVSMRPMVSYTTKDAQNSLDPYQRQCYKDDEVTLKHIRKEAGSFYDMNNCLLNYALENIKKTCRCKPIFQPPPLVQADKAARVPFCTDKGIKCMYKIINDIGGTDDSAIVISDAGEQSGSASRPCYSRCNYQEHYLRVSSSEFPQKGTFVFHKEFCYVAKKLLLGPCTDLRRSFVDEYHPDLCNVLNARRHLIVEKGDCADWPSQFLFENPGGALETAPKYNISEADKVFIDAVQRYAEENLASVKVLYRAKYVHSIKRDVAISFTSFIANTGGLLGLCMGFSFVSFFELLYHCLKK